jgi:hypothetical protein
MRTSADGVFFVNKGIDSESLSHSSTDEKYEIQSHVQSKRRKCHWLAKQLSRKAALAATAHAHSLDHCPHYDISESFSSSSQSSTPEPMSLEDLPRNLQPDSEKRSQGRIPRVYPTNNAFDPFHCTSVSIDFSTNRLLQYTFTNFAQSTFRAEALGPPARTAAPSRNQSAMVRRLQRCVEDEMLMYATLAYGSSCLRWTLGKQHRERLPEFYIGKTLELVRLRLLRPGEPIDSWLILSIYALSVSEMWNAIPEMRRMTSQISEMYDGSGVTASTTHLKMLRHLVEEVGGMTSLDPYVMESLILGDKYRALYQMLPPIFDLTWDPGPVPLWRRGDAGIQDSLPLPELGAGFVETAEQDLGLDIRAIISDTVDYFRIAHSSWAQPHVTVDE